MITSPSGSIRRLRAVAGSRTSLDAESFLEKDAKWKRLNEEIERNSRDIFDKMEAYSIRCSQMQTIVIPVDIGGAGDGPQEDPRSSSPKNIKTSWGSSRGTRGSSSSSSSSQQPCTQMSLLHSPTEDDFRIDTGSSTQARRRLQKATDSVVKCLQSKLLSHESRLADLHVQFRQKIQENTMLDAKVKALEEDREKLLRSLANLQAAFDKASKAAEVAKSNLNLKMQAMAALKKDMDAQRREEKIRASTVQNLQTRLNRVTDENERLKQQNRSLLGTMRDRQTEDRSTIDELRQKIIHLEQQKTTLNATISKQAGLIKTIRNHKSMSTEDVVPKSVT